MFPPSSAQNKDELSSSSIPRHVLIAYIRRKNLHSIHTHSFLGRSNYYWKDTENNLLNCYIIVVFYLILQAISTLENECLQTDIIVDFQSSLLFLLCTDKPISTEDLNVTTLIIWLLFNCNTKYEALLAITADVRKI